MELGSTTIFFQGKKKEPEDHKKAAPHSANSYSPSSFMISANCKKGGATCGKCHVPTFHALQRKAELGGEECSPVTPTSSKSTKPLPSVSASMISFYDEEDTREEHFISKQENQKEEERGRET